MPYIGTQPNDVKKNTGLYTPSEILQLEKDGHWGGSLELIEAKTISSSSTAIFTDIKENVYDVHYLTVENCTVSNDDVPILMRFFENGVEESGSVYQRAEWIIDSGGGSADFRSTASSALYNIWNIGNGTNESGCSYTYFYNLGNSSKYSFITNQEVHISPTPYQRMTFGGGVLPQASLVDQIKLFVTSGTFSATAKLYGVKQ
jgi:hypothetical protein